MKKMFITALMAMTLIGTQANASDEEASETLPRRGAILSADHQVISQSNNEQQSRVRPLEKTLTPVLGYVESAYEGRKGLEGYANGYLNNGYDMHLNIDISLQQKIEMMLDNAKDDLQAEEFIAAVMESSTGKVLAAASSNRYDPNYITMQDISSLNPKIAIHPYEPGAVMQPLALAVALENDVVSADTWIDTYNGELKMGERLTITDSEKFHSLTAADSIVHSSNIGIAEISRRLDGWQFRDGLMKFGLSQPSGIDLSRDLPGFLKSQQKLDSELHRANTSYGYGMHATFAQLLKAYSAFNNDGRAVTPKIIDYFTDKNGKHHKIESTQPDKQALSKETAKEMHHILAEAVNRGTGINAQHKGLDIGGKTGTARIRIVQGSSGGYYSSFYGFANDTQGHRYTIGVLAIRVSKPGKFYASRSAVPVFAGIVDVMVGMGYLVEDDL